MASIKRYKTAKGTAWRVQYRSPDGKSRTKQGFRTKDQAQAWAEKNAVAVRAGDWVAPEDTRRTVRDVGEQWWRQRPPVKKSTRTLDESTWQVHIIPRWGDVPVGSIKPSSVQEWVTQGDWGPSTARRAYGMLNQIMGVAVMDRVILANPCEGVRLPRKPEPRHVYLTPSQLDTLVQECTVHQELVLLLGTVGLRWGEAAGLQVGDIDFLRRRIRVERNAVTVKGKIVVGTPKTHECRSVTVPAVVLELLEPLTRGKAKTDWVFPARDGGPLRKPSGRHFLKTACERLQKDDPDFPTVTAHGLRHVAAGLMVNSGANVLQVARQLGHAKPSITLDTYADLWEDGLDALGVQMNGVLSDVVELSWGEAN